MPFCLRRCNALASHFAIPIVLHMGRTCNLLLLVHSLYGIMHAAYQQHFVFGVQIKWIQLCRYDVVAGASVVNHHRHNVEIVLQTRRGRTGTLGLAASRSHPHRVGIQFSWIVYLVQYDHFNICSLLFIAKWQRSMKYHIACVLFSHGNETYSITYLETLTGDEWQHLPMLLGFTYISFID